MTDFFQAVRREGQDALLALRELGDVNITNEDGENLLHVAIAYANTPAATELIRRGIDVNAQDSKGMTPLHYAAAHHNALVAEQILDHGGDIAVTDKHGNTALWTAVFHAKGTFDVVNLLIERGAAKFVHQKNRHGRSPLDFAIQIGDSSLVNLISKDASGLD